MPKKYMTSLSENGIKNWKEKVSSSAKISLAKRMSIQPLHMVNEYIYWTLDLRHYIKMMLAKDGWRPDAAREREHRLLLSIRTISFW